MKLYNLAQNDIGNWMVVTSTLDEVLYFADLADALDWISQEESNDA